MLLAFLEREIYIQYFISSVFMGGGNSSHNILRRTESLRKALNIAIENGRTATTGCFYCFDLCRCTRFSMLEQACRCAEGRGLPEVVSCLWPGSPWAGDSHSGIRDEVSLERHGSS
jgi:hypothetical protein